jgi:hypothetical protein
VLRLYALAWGQAADTDSSKEQRQEREQRKEGRELGYQEDSSGSADALRLNKALVGDWLLATLGVAAAVLAMMSSSLRTYVPATVAALDTYAAEAAVATSATSSTSTSTSTSAPTTHAKEHQVKQAQAKKAKEEAEAELAAVVGTARGELRCAFALLERLARDQDAVLLAQSFTRLRLMCRYCHHVPILFTYSLFFFPPSVPLPVLSVPK